MDEILLHLQATKDLEEQHFQWHLHLEPKQRCSACHQQARLRFEGMLFIPT